MSFFSGSNFKRSGYLYSSSIPNRYCNMHSNSYAFSLWVVPGASNLPIRNRWRSSCTVIFTFRNANSCSSHKTTSWRHYTSLRPTKELLLINNIYILSCMNALTVNTTEIRISNPSSNSGRGCLLPTVLLLLLLLLLLFSPWKVFTSALADGLSLKFEWYQVSSSLQDSSQYSGLSQ